MSCPNLHDSAEYLHYIVLYIDVYKVLEEI
jgi:hypothetical protein